MKISINNEEYIDIIKMFDADIITLGSWAAGEVIGGRRLAIKHDVDVFLEAAVEMAEYENKNNIKSTYFMLHTNPYFKRSSEFRSACKEIERLGHDIGFHNNALVESYRTKIPIKKIIKDSLSILRDYCGVKVIGTTAHGDKMTYTRGLYNYSIWSGYDPDKNEGPPVKRNSPLSLSQFGLKYEAYFMPSIGYMTDSAAVWASMIFDDGPRPYERKLRAVSSRKNFDAVTAFNKMEKGVFQILIHPVRMAKWTNFAAKRRKKNKNAKK